MKTDLKLNQESIIDFGALLCQTSIFRSFIFFSRSFGPLNTVLISLCLISLNSFNFLYLMGSVLVNFFFFGIEFIDFWLENSLFLHSCAYVILLAFRVCSFSRFTFKKVQNNTKYMQYQILRNCQAKSNNFRLLTFKISTLSHLNW